MITMQDLVTKTDFDDKFKSQNQNMNSDKTKNLLVENEFKKLQTFDSIYLRGESHFKEDATQNYLVFRYFKKIAGVDTGNYIYYWKSKGLSDEDIAAPTTSDYSFNPQLSYFGTKTRLEFRGSYLKQDKITLNTFTIRIYYKIYIKTSPTLVNSLFRAVSMTKMLILISINILDTELYLIEGMFFQLVIDLVEM